ncbi:MAG: SDR family NAD(P)-dependent oxidoreductase, partial [Candidatus Kapabacteria bacterium]|nr:SDR family NAD(P)-dependent oxidoreductase [Candidatus Kapabacteria bacterium]
MKKIFVFGATSQIIQECLKHFANDKANFYLVARDLSKLEIVSNDLKARGASEVYINTCDALDYKKHSEIISDGYNKLGKFDIALIGHGTLPDNEAIRNNNIEAVKEFEINCNSYISICSVLSEYFEKQRNGTIAVITSVAGDRGRQSNYIYGASKGA